MKLLPNEVVSAIWAAAETGRQPAENEARAAQAWLSRAFEAAVRRAERMKSTTPLTAKDVDRVRRAYDRFQAVIRSLQDRDMPPPTIPVTDGATDWEHWIGSMNGGFKLGRDPRLDWRLIERLLQFYEAITDRSASGADDGNPTMRFLDTALDAFTRVSGRVDGSYFRAPSADALRRELPKMRETWNGTRDPRLAILSRAPDGGGMR